MKDPIWKAGCAAPGAFDELRLLPDGRWMRHAGWGHGSPNGRTTNRIEEYTPEQATEWFIRNDIDVPDMLLLGKSNPRVPPAQITSKPDPERDALLAQADAEQVASEEKKRQLRERHDTNDRCLAANKRFAEAVSKLQLSVYREPFDQNPSPPTDHKPFLPPIHAGLLEVCRALKGAGHERTWNEIKDRIDPRNLCDNSDRTETSFRWAKVLLNQGFSGAVLLSDIQTTWDKVPLRGALVWVQIVINSLLGELRRLDLIPDEKPVDQTPPPNCPNCGSPPAALDVDDDCPSCGVWRFECGQIRHIPLSDAPPIIQQIRKPLWTRVPPSEVRAPRRGSAKIRKSPQRKRNREPRAVTLLLALLDDQTNANLNLTELAQKIEMSLSAVSRAFHHKKYGPILTKRYEDYRLLPPRIRDI
jgi:hypothetical protein